MPGTVTISSRSTVYAIIAPCAASWDSTISVLAAPVFKYSTSVLEPSVSGLVKGVTSKTLPEGSILYQWPVGYEYQGTVPSTYTGPRLYLPDGKQKGIVSLPVTRKVVSGVLYLSVSLTFGEKFVKAQHEWMQPATPYAYNVKVYSDLDDVRTTSDEFNVYINESSSAFNVTSFTSCGVTFTSSPL